MEEIMNINICHVLASWSACLKWEEIFKNIIFLYVIIFANLSKI